jgi:hypothetical protein
MNWNPPASRHSKKDAGLCRSRCTRVEARSMSMRRSGSLQLLKMFPLPDRQYAVHVGMRLLCSQERDITGRQTRMDQVKGRVALAGKADGEPFDPEKAENDKETPQESQINRHGPAELSQRAQTSFLDLGRFAR